MSSKHGASPGLRGPDLPLLFALEALLEEGNVTRAAARLGMSQPALSTQLARLRQLFGDPLLAPIAGARTLAPTPFALRLLQRLRPALAGLSAALETDDDSFDPTACARVFRIAANGIAAALVLPALLAGLQACANPQLQFIVVDAEPAGLAAQLERGGVDLFLGTPCTLPPDLRCTTLLTAPPCMVQRPGHPRGTAPVGLDEYCEALAHLNVAHDSALHGRIDEQLYRIGRSRQVALALRDVGLVPMLLGESELVCTLPAPLAQRFVPTLEAVPLAFALPPTTLCMAWHGRADTDPALAWLRAGVVRAVGREAQGLSG